MASERICPACGGVHTYAKCPGCGEEKWSLALAVADLTDEVLDAAVDAAKRPDKYVRGKKEREKFRKWIRELVGGNLNQAMACARSIDDVCRCTVQFLLESKEDAASEITRRAAARLAAHKVAHGKR